MLSHAHLTAPRRPPPGRRHRAGAQSPAAPADRRGSAAEDAEHLFERLVLGRLEPAEIAGMLIALRMKGETAEEMIGAARGLFAAALPFERPDYLFADCCGTGGDGSGLINVSTAVAFVAAACGLPIAKHGNRSVSSRCGSADVLEALGAKIDVDPATARALLDETGFCFLFAPAYHPGMKHAGAGPPPIAGAHGDEPARPVHQSGAAAGAIARRRRSKDAARGSPRRLTRWGSRRRWSSTARASTKSRSTARPGRSGCRNGGIDELDDHARGCRAGARTAGASSTGGDVAENAGAAASAAGRRRRRGRAGHRRRSTRPRCC